MKPDKVFDLRFLVPPVLVVATIFLFSPSDVFILIRQSDSWLFGVALLLAFGFVISGATEFFVNLFNLRNFDTKLHCDPESVEKAIRGELEAWERLDGAYEILKGQVGGQVHKRWNMAMANWSSAVAITLFGFPLVYYLVSRNAIHLAPDWELLVCAVLNPLLLVLLLNGLDAYKSVGVINNILKNRPKTTVATAGDSCGHR